MKEISYDINAVTGRLSARIANLELALAHEQASRESYQKRVKELESATDNSKNNAE